MMSGEEVFVRWCNVVNVVYDFCTRGSGETRKQLSRILGDHVKGVCRGGLSLKTILVGGTEFKNSSGGVYHTVRPRCTLQNCMLLFSYLKMFSSRGLSFPPLLKRLSVGEVVVRVVLLVSLYCFFLIVRNGCYGAGCNLECGVVSRSHLRSLGTWSDVFPENLSHKISPPNVRKQVETKEVVAARKFPKKSVGFPTAVSTSAIAANFVPPIGQVVSPVKTRSLDEFEITRGPLTNPQTVDTTGPSTSAFHGPPSPPSSADSSAPADSAPKAAVSGRYEPTTLVPALQGRESVMAATTAPSSPTVLGVVMASERRKRRPQQPNFLPFFVHEDSYEFSGKKWRREEVGESRWDIVNQRADYVALLRELDRVYRGVSGGHNPSGKNVGGTPSTLSFGGGYDIRQGRAIKAFYLVEDDTVFCDRDFRYLEWLTDEVLRANSKKPMNKHEHDIRVVLTGIGASGFLIMASAVSWLLENYEVPPRLDPEKFFKPKAMVFVPEKYLRNKENPKLKSQIVRGKRRYMGQISGFVGPAGRGVVAVEDLPKGAAGVAERKAVSEGEESSSSGGGGRAAAKETLSSSRELVRGEEQVVGSSAGSSSLPAAHQGGDRDPPVATARGAPPSGGALPVATRVVAVGRIGRLATDPGPPPPRRWEGSLAGGSGLERDQFTRERDPEHEELRGGAKGAFLPVPEVFGGLKTAPPPETGPGGSSAHAPAVLEDEKSATEPPPVALLLGGAAGPSGDKPANNLLAPTAKASSLLEQQQRVIPPHREIRRKRLGGARRLNTSPVLDHPTSRMVEEGRRVQPKNVVVMPTAGQLIIAPAKAAAGARAAKQAFPLRAASRADQTSKGPVWAVRIAQTYNVHIPQSELSLVPLTRGPDVFLAERPKLMLHVYRLRVNLNVHIGGHSILGFDPKSPKWPQCFELVGT